MTKAEKNETLINFNTVNTNIAKAMAHVRNRYGYTRKFFLTAAIYSALLQLSKNENDSELTAMLKE